jgi:hypothetical protein
MIYLAIAYLAHLVSILLSYTYRSTHCKRNDACKSAAFDFIVFPILFIVFFSVVDYNLGIATKDIRKAFEVQKKCKSKVDIRTIADKQIVKCYDGEAK